MCSITEEITIGVRRDDKGVPLATVTSDALTVHVGRSVEDGVPYVMIDTNTPGPMRVDLNDGTIWDGNTEEDQAHWLDGFMIMTNHEGELQLLCLDCGEFIPAGEPRRTMRGYIADAKLHQCKAKS